VPVGDLAFRLDPLLVAGKAVCKGAPGFRPALAVEALVRGRWGQAGLVNLILLEDGRFEIRGELEAFRDAALRVSSRDFGNSVSVPFELGQKDVELQLEVVLPKR